MSQPGGMTPAEFCDPPNAEWAAAHAYMCALGLECVSYCPGHEASYAARGSGKFTPIAMSLTGSRQPDGTYSIHVHGPCPRARRAQQALAIARHYIDLPVSLQHPWIFSSGGVVSTVLGGERRPFVVGDWLDLPR